MAPTLPAHRRRYSNPSPCVCLVALSRRLNSNEEGVWRHLVIVSRSKSRSPAAEREGARDGAGGAVAGEVPAGSGDHDGRRRAPARLHDLPQQALPVLVLLRLLLLHRLRRPILLLLQADVGTRGSSNNPGVLTYVLLANSVLAPVFYKKNESPLYYLRSVPHVAAAVVPIELWITVLSLCIE